MYAQTARPNALHAMKEQVLKRLLELRKQVEIEMERFKSLQIIEKKLRGRSIKLGSRVKLLGDQDFSGSLGTLVKKESTQGVVNIDGLGEFEVPYEFLVLAKESNTELLKVEPVLERVIRGDIKRN